MNTDQTNDTTITAADSATPTAPEAEQYALIKTIGKTTYKVKIHFSTTSKETMSDKIMRMLKNEVQQIKYNTPFTFTKSME